MLNGRQETISTGRMATMIDVSPRRIQQLVEQGKVEKVARGQFDPFAVVPAYVRFLRQRAEYPEANDAELRRARLRKLKADSKAREIQNAVALRQFVPMEMVSRHWRRIMEDFRGSQLQ